MGRAVVTLVVIVSLSLNSLATLVPTGSAPGGWMRVTVKPGEGGIASQAQPLILTAEKLDFRSDEQPRFWLIVEPEKKEENKISFVQEARAAEQVKTEVFYAGKKINIPVKVEEDNEGNLALSLSPQREFKPGRYALKASFSEGGVSYQGTQDFTWGVLAINTDKSIYLLDEEAFIGMAVLDNQGKMVCDAKVSLEITDPEGQKTNLTTENGEIKISEECTHYGVTNLPDYYTFYQVGQAGDYQMRLTAETKNGTRSITDQFRVQESVDFEVKREGPTRIYPLATYEMRMIVKANEDFDGQIVERAPATFALKPGNFKTFNIYVMKGIQEIIWDVHWKKGETYELVYGFDAQDESPMFYLLGPLEIGAPSTGSGQVFQEARQWQIASDATIDSEDWEAFADGDTTLDGSLWSNLTGDDCDMQTDSGGTPSTGTGPSVDHTYGDSTHKYLYLETSSGWCQGTDLYAQIETDNIDADTYSVDIDFWWHMYGSTIGSLHLDVYDGIWNNSVWNRSGQGTPTADAWYNQQVDLDAYTGTINLRFRAISAGNYYGDIALDDIVITGDLRNSAPNAPTLSKLFNNERTGDDTPTFEFSATDSDTDDLEYQIEIDDDYNFGSINITANSETPDPGFTSGHPFTSGDPVNYTVQSGDALSNGTYWWQVKAKDPGGSNSWSSYSSKRSLTINTGMGAALSEWFQTTDEQFDTDTLTDTEITGADSVKVVGW